MKEFSMTITFDPMTKDCKVTGPVNDPELCYLGLELAKRVIGQHKERAAIAIVQPQKITVPVPNFLKRRAN